MWKFRVTIITKQPTLRFNFIFPVHFLDMFLGVSDYGGRAFRDWKLSAT